MADDVKYPHIEVKLVGREGNAFAIIGTVVRALRRHGVPPDAVKEFTEEATSGDYDNLLATCLEWVTVR